MKWKQLLYSFKTDKLQKFAIQTSQKSTSINSQRPNVRDYSLKENQIARDVEKTGSGEGGQAADVSFMICAKLRQPNSTPQAM